MRGVHLFMFVVLIPALVALGHDCYLFYENQDRGFMFAALGFIWTRYEPESYRWTVENLPDYWPWINLLLEQKAFFAGLVFAGFFYVILGILKLCRAGPFAGETGKKFSTGNRTDELMGRAGKSDFKYKRK